VQTGGIGYRQRMSRLIPKLRYRDEFKLLSPSLHPADLTARTKEERQVKGVNNPRHDSMADFEK